VKIALCIEYPIGQHGGTEVLVRELVMELSKQHEIVLVSPDDDSSLRASVVGGSIHRHISWRTEPATRARSRELAALLLKERPDLVHFHFGGNFGWSNRRPGRCPIPAVARCGIPVVTTIHMAVGLLHGYCGPQKPWWFKVVLLPFAWLNKLRVLRHVHTEIAVSHQDLRRLKRWYWPVRKKFQAVYHSRIKPTTDDAVPVVREKVILAVGHLAHRKGQAVLAEGFAKIAARFTDWKLLFAGHTAEPATANLIKQHAARVGADRIQLLGQRADVAQLMQRATIYVQPSFHEGLPLSLQEALWHGCACIATEIPGNVELIASEQTGLLVPGGDPEAMAGAIRRLIEAPELCAQFSRAGRPTLIAKGMTKTQMIENHQRIYAAIG
jgi:glycosyltransferase involved in cell wall biosynthesis